MTGTIEKVYRTPNYSTCWVLGDDGVEYFLHHTEMVQNSKHYKKGKKVSFDIEDKGLPHKNATNCAIDGFVEAKPTHTGRGTWMRMTDLGEPQSEIRLRCSDCWCTSDQGETNYCPHCGASMKEDLPDNTEQILRRKARLTPLNSWKFVSMKMPTLDDSITAEYRCSHCKGISKYEASFCPHCGSYMVRKEESKRW